MDPGRTDTSLPAGRCAHARTAEPPTCKQDDCRIDTSRRADDRFRRSVALFALIALLPVTGLAHALAGVRPPPWKAWQSLLHRHVQVIDNGHASRVDYAGLLREKSQLDDYVASLSRVTRDRFNAWSRSQQMAFLINAYNAYTVELVLTRWPRLQSIRNIGSWLEKPWEIRFFSLLGTRRNLDDIEGLLRDRRKFADPRVHFAINCASIGCPMLQPFAYTGDRLDAQLRTATRDFLSDRDRNRYDPDHGLLKVSRIFDWYGADFESSRFHSVRDFLATHAAVLADTPSARARIRLKQVPISFLSYDWALNDVHSSSR